MTQPVSQIDRLLALPRFAPRRRAAFWLRIARAAGLRRQRARLASLDAHLLRDIGITADDARTEASRPAWDVPRHWLE